MFLPARMSLGLIAHTLFFALTCLSLSVWADGPADNVPDKVRPIPPEGIEVPKATAEKLTVAAGKLEEALAKIKSVTESDRAQIGVFPRAVRMTLADNMFYSEKEIEHAFTLLNLGHARLMALSSGTSGAKLLLPDSQPEDKPILTVGAYRSRIDGSIQPFGLVLPPSVLKDPARPRRLDVWLHGRGEKSSEVAFLQQRLTSVGDIAPPETIVLHPYGRYCNAFKFAGEIDILEAIDEVKRLLVIDANRVTIRGFSMGGAGCWQMAVHYPGMWMAATPGAGFSETREFLKVFQKEDFQPTDSQSLLLHWYDCPDWSNNLRLLPTVAYSGEVDNQKQAADVMAAAMKVRGLELKHIIGPQTGHKIHPDSKLEIEQFLTDAAKSGRASLPAEIDFTTYTLRYANHAWLTIEGLEKHWHEARVKAKIQSPVRVEMTTKNIGSLSIKLPVDQQLLSRTEPVELVIDNQKLFIPMFIASQPIEVLLTLKLGSWQVAVPESTQQLRKRPGLQGPIDDAFMDAFMFVGPNKEVKQPSAVDQWIDDEFQHAKTQWRKHFRGDIVQPVNKLPSAAEIASHNLVLFGTPESNSLIADILDKMPLEWKAGDTLTLGKNKQSAATHVPVLIYPNPLNPNRYVVINSGFTYREFAYLNNARQIPMLPDWAIVDVTSGRDYQNPGKVTAAGFFDEAWRAK